MQGLAVQIVSVSAVRKVVLVARKVVLSDDMKTASERVSLVLETLTATVYKRSTPESRSLASY